MHDPMTVAFTIRSPFKASVAPFVRKGYRAPLITIWHVDPEDRRGMVVRSADDTCGWFTPPYSPEAHDRIRALGKDEYSTIFERQAATVGNKSYAYVYYEPSAYDAIYWAWRSIKHQERRGRGWKYGKPLSTRELDYVYSLAANPVDNLRMTFSNVKDAETCADLFTVVYKCFLRFNRPWWRHPRWHVWHWHIQIHPWQQLRRWLFTRCTACGKRFPYGYSPVSHNWNTKPPKMFQSETDVYHAECSSVLMKAQRLAKAAEGGGDE